MSKKMTSAEAAAYLWANPGAVVKDVLGAKISVNSEGWLEFNGRQGDGSLLAFCRQPFTILVDPDELPEDVRTARTMNQAVEALWKHIKPEAKK